MQLSYLAVQKLLTQNGFLKPKKDVPEKIERYKARLVVRGCRQTEGIDYQETYSSVVRYISIRFLCALAVKHNLQMEQMDIVTAYLH